MGRTETTDSGFSKSEQIAKSIVENDLFEQGAYGAGFSKSEKIAKSIVENDLFEQGAYLQACPFEKLVRKVLFSTAY